MANENTKIFSEAIAEAKAIRETAMANAKLALEEAFAPRMQEMMSTKLAALAEDDEDMEENFKKSNSTNDNGMVAQPDAMEEISLEELLAELEGLEEDSYSEEEDSVEPGLNNPYMEENEIFEAEDAKLLYVNKLFKSKNLTEAQKVKVINAFDRAETVKETKNIFETLQESLTATQAKKNPIKESLSFASKSAGVADRKPIVENNEFIARMQFLAGIK